ncbi:multiple epidermal growth factor-like domains protein 10 [Saccostrea cucullata]|uniref:multiple epidermal growth factor-like domains protein 10 n=1 Tax=Saccostrea cuccullata TaxID=36930 RepID=UPI002ED3FE7A
MLTENLALNKPAVQSSTFTSVVNFSAVLAVDGNTDQRAARNSCARTNFDPIVWWRVDLQATRNIYSIKVFYRNDSDQHGCSKDFVYGKNCDRPCPDNCLGRECHIVTGYCQECIDGRQGQQCDKCNDGFFGPNCTTHCSEFCNNVTCDSSTGECLFGCAAGFTGLQCNTRCIGGNYGENCSSDCGHCVRGKMCDHVSGLCEGGCAEGYKGQICKTPCSHGEYGKNCSQRCSSNCLNGEICNPFYGRCISCTPGWKGLLCKEGRF